MTCSERASAFCNGEGVLTFWMAGQVHFTVYTLRHVSCSWNTMYTFFAFYARRENLPRFIWVTQQIISALDAIKSGRIFYFSFSCLTHLLCSFKDIIAFAVSKTSPWARSPHGPLVPLKGNKSHCVFGKVCYPRVRKVTALDFGVAFSILSGCLCPL